MCETTPPAKSRLSRLIRRIAKHISDKNRQRRLAQASVVLNILVVVSFAALTFSPSWLPWVSFTAWALALLIALLYGFLAFVVYDVTALEQTERELASSLQASLDTTKANLEKAEKAHKDYSLAVKGALLPLAVILEQITLTRTSRDAVERLGAFKSMALTMLHQTAGATDHDHAARSTLYELDEHGDPVYQSHAGRAETPRNRFEGESLKKVKKLIDSGTANSFDVDDSENSVEPSPGSRYKAVVATAIGRTEPRHGMLTVDSTDKKQLSDDDWPILQSVGGMLAASYRIVTLVEELEEAQRKVQPEAASGPAPER